MPLFQVAHRFVLTISAVLFAPTIAILMTWNTLPGQPLYPIKRNLEAYAEVIVSPSYTASVNLQFRLLNRRIWEADQTLALATPEALPELTTQVTHAHKVITQNPHNPNHTNELTTQLALANHALEKHKRNYSATELPTPKPYTDELPQDIPPKFMVHQIELTQSTIQNTIQDLNQ